MDRQTDRRTDGQTDRQTDKQTLTDRQKGCVLTLHNPGSTADSPRPG